MSSESRTNHELLRSAGSNWLMENPSVARATDANDKIPKSEVEKAKARGERIGLGSIGWKELQRRGG
jgi:hypothetical protein